MSGYYVEVREDGLHQVYWTEDGLRRVEVSGGTFTEPRQAIDYAKELEEAAAEPE